MENLADTARRLFKAYEPIFRGSITFVDSTFTEIIHWNLGQRYFYQQLGVIELCPLGTKTFNQPVQTISKATFLIGTYFEDHFSALEDTIRLFSADALKEITCLMALPEHVYSPVQGFASPFAYYAHVLQNECGANAVVRVENLPVVYASLTSGAFVLPAASRLFPPPAPPSERIELDDLADSLKAQFLLFVQLLSTFLTAFNIREDVYVLGAVSDLIGRTLRSFPRKTSAPPTGLLPVPERRASLIIVDRTLDMVAPMCHSENLLDRIYASLPFLGPESNDLRVPLPSDCFGNNLHGCLSHPQSAPAQYLLDVLASRRGRDGFASVCRKLAELLAADSVSLSASQKPTGAMNSAALSSILKSLMEPPRALRHHAALQVANALLHSLGPEASASWDQLMGIEKMVMLSAGDNQQRIDSLLSQLLDLCIAGPGGRLPVRSVLKLVIFLYSLLGTDSLDESHEQPLRRVLAGILLEHPQSVDVGWLGSVRTDLEKHLSSRGSATAAKAATATASSSSDFETNWEWKEEPAASASTVTSSSNEETLYKALDAKIAAALETARKAGALRADFSSLREVLRGAGAPVYTPLLQQLVTQLFDEKISDVTDLQRQESSALGSLLKTGFSHFGFQAKKPKPRDNNILIIFVVGGVTWMEVERIREAAGKFANYQILVGGTCVTNADRAYDQLFQCD